MSEGNSNNKSVERNVSTWCRIERLLLILTFFFTAVATIYSVRLAKKTLIQVENELRPWIIIPQVESYFKADRMETKFQIRNIGKMSLKDAQIAGQKFPKNPVPLHKSSMR